MDVELNEGRLSISVTVEEKEEDKNKNYLQREFTAYSATRGVYLKDAACEGLSATFADGVLTVTVLKSWRRRTSPRSQSTSEVPHTAFLLRPRRPNRTPGGVSCVGPGPLPALEGDRRVPVTRRHGMALP